MSVLDAVDRMYWVLLDEFKRCSQANVTQAERLVQQV